MIIHNEIPENVATVTGIWTENTEDAFSGLSRLIYVKPVSGNTQYDFKITGPDNEVIFHQKACLSAICDNTPIAVRGIYTMRIENANRDIGFLVKWSIQE